MLTDTDLGEESSLIAALQAGDAAASGRLVNRYHGLLFGLCMRMLGHRQDAEDVLQETFLRAIRAIRGFDDRKSLRPWLLGIAANRCRTALARRKRLPVNAFLDEAPSDNPPPNLVLLDLSTEIDRALSRLRPEYREVFLLFHQRGLPYEQIGESLGRPIGTIKTWLHRARAELAGELERRGITV
jgi:RNA polymerase sigma-70 factor (ECF subfamily)